MADAVRVINDLTTFLTDAKRPYPYGLCYNATQDAFYFVAPSTLSTFQHYKVTWAMSASITGAATTVQTNHWDWQSAVDDDQFIVTVYTTSTQYALKRYTISTETLSAANTTIGAPGAVARRIRIGTTGTDSMVVVYHGPSEKVHGTNYERLYYRTYTPSTNTFGSETIYSDGTLAPQTGTLYDWQVDSSRYPLQLRGNYTQDRARFWIVVGGSTYTPFYDASAGSWSYVPGVTIGGFVHNYNGGTEEAYAMSATAGNVARLDGWNDSTPTNEAVTNAANNHDNLLHVDHAADEVFLTQASSTTNMRRKKRSSGGTWDTSWTNDSVTLTSATAIRTGNTNDAILMEKSGTKYLVRTVITDQAAGRGLHLVRMALGVPPQTIAVGVANE